MAIKNIYLSFEQDTTTTPPTPHQILLVHINNRIEVRDNDLNLRELMDLYGSMLSGMARSVIIKALGLQGSVLLHMGLDTVAPPSTQPGFY